MTLLQKIKDLTYWNENNKLKEILLGINSSITPDAPEDGIQYARQDGEWTEISSGGGSQDLQSVLENGSLAIIEDNLNIAADDILIKSNDILRFAVNEQYYKIPNDKSDGNYILATTDEITLQNVADNNSTATLDLGLGRTTFITLADDEGVTIFRGTQENESVNTRGELKITPSDVVLESERIDTDETHISSAYIGVSDQGTIEISQISGADYFETDLGFDTPIANTTIKFQALPSGNYKISVARIYTDNTTVVKSSATLTADYPDALLGDKVHATSIIIGGGLIYEKTTTGWGQTPLTVTF